MPPHTREVGLAIESARRRGGQVGLAVARTRRSGSWEVQPLREGTVSEEREQDQQPMMLQVYPPVSQSYFSGRKRDKGLAAGLRLMPEYPIMVGNWDHGAPP